MPIYTVKYYAGPYSGQKTVSADDEEEAIQKVRRDIRGQMTLSMYSDGYKIVSELEEDEDYEQ